LIALIHCTVGLAGAVDNDAAGDDIRSLAEKIDEHIARRWQEQQVTPAPPAEDAEFLRRVYIDIAGKIPSVAEVREFLADPSPGKRSAVVERLLESPGYITNFTIDFVFGHVQPSAAR
jgi:hypothetical protein